MLVNMTLCFIAMIFLGYAIVQLPELTCSVYKYAQERFLGYKISRQEVPSQGIV